MRKLILSISFLLISIIVFSQAFPVIPYRVSGATSTFGVNIPVGSTIINVANGEMWKVTDAGGLTSSASISSSIAKLKRVGIEYKGGTAINVDGDEINLSINKLSTVSASGANYIASVNSIGEHGKTQIGLLPFMPNLATINNSAIISDYLYWRTEGSTTLLRMSFDALKTLVGSSSTGMTNPMTATGDIIYSISGSTPARLPVSTNGRVLTLKSGLPSWEPATAETSQWTTETYGITYGSNVGIGKSSSQIIGLDVLRPVQSYSGSFKNTYATGMGLYVDIASTSNSHAAFNVVTGGTNTFDISGSGSIKMRKIPKTTQSYVLGFNESTKEVTYFATPSGGGGMVWPSSGIPVSTGSSWGASKAAPDGQIVGTTDPQSLTQKSINGVTLDTTFPKYVFLSGDGQYYEIHTNKRQAAVTTTLNFLNGNKSSRAITGTGANTITITNLPDAAEGSIEISNASTATLTLVGSTGYTTVKKMGTQANIKANGNTTVVYWRSNTILYYGFIHEN